jgi:hypothetical protein
VTAGRPVAERLLAALAAGAAVAVALTGCDGRASRAAAPGSTPATATPASADELQDLLVTSVPSGLPRLPDDELQPPAGEKSLSDTAGYAGDPPRERSVLAALGYRFGWERFWGRLPGQRGGVETSVFVDQFRSSSGARAFAADLARNDEQHYGATAQERPAGLPSGCRLLTVATPDGAGGLDGPAAFAWCSRGPFSVAVTALAESVDAAEAEVVSVAGAQLARLPAA